MYRIPTGIKEIMCVIYSLHSRYVLKGQAILTAVSIITALGLRIVKEPKAVSDISARSESQDHSQEESTS